MLMLRSSRLLVAAAGLVSLLVVLASAPATGQPPRDAENAYSGYLFTYFTGEQYADGEQVYMALSKGDDPLHWRELNGGQPVLRSALGEKGVRDPFIIRSPEGEKFFLLATDLKMYGNGDWDEAQRHGSRSIVIWESTDLVNWSHPRTVEVSPETAGNTWAPEAYWDHRRRTFVVFWASQLFAKDDPNHEADSYNRMMYATTKDFRSFTPAKVWHDPGHHVIDSTVARDGDTYYRMTKDERGTSSDAPCGKFITEEKSQDLLDLDWELVAECIGKGTGAGDGIAQGEGPTIFKSNRGEKWYTFIDEYTGRGYVPFETNDLDSGQWTISGDYAMPENSRHGTVMPLTQEEFTRLENRWGLG